MSTAPEDKYKKFEDDGVTFKAKLIGSELVMEPRGDKMCQNSIQRLKAIIKGQKVHKRRIVMKISYAGVKICDEKTNEILYHHEVPQISFIASDDTDSRTFGYVCDVPNKAHQFICFKTGGPSLQVMSEISSLFEAVLAKKKKQDEVNKQDSPTTTTTATATTTTTTTTTTSTPSVKGLAPAAPTTPATPINDNNNGHQTDTHQRDADSPTAFFTKDLFSDGNGSGGSVGAGAGGDSGIMDLTFNDWLPSPSSQQSVNVHAGAQRQHQQATSIQQTATSAPGGGGVALPQQPLTSSHQQLATTTDPASTSPFVDEVFTSGSGPTAAIPIAKPPHRPQQLNFTSSSFSGTHMGSHMLSSTTPAAPTPIMNNSPLSAGITNYRFPGAQNKSLVYNHSSVSLNDAALSNRSPSFATPMMSQQQQHHQQPAGFVRQESTDKYAVFNDIDALPSIFESISSLDSSSMKLSNAGQQLHPGSQSMDHRQHHQPGGVGVNVPMRGMFNTRSSTAVTATSQQYQPSPAASDAARRMNPFDDDFFA